MSRHRQVHATGQDLPCHHPPAVSAGFRAKQLATPDPHLFREDRAAVFRAPPDVIPQDVDATCEKLHLPGHADDFTHRLRQTT
jgi:hypothetical protein